MFTPCKHNAAYDGNILLQCCFIGFRGIKFRGLDRKRFWKYVDNAFAVFNELIFLLVENIG